MQIRGKAVGDLTQEDLEALVADQFCERRTLDYKAQVTVSTEGEKKEFLKDISSFANAQGGVLLLGVSEECGIPVDVAGIEVADRDGMWLQLESSIRDGISPRLAGIEHSWIELSSGKAVLAIQIPASFASPHRVTYRGSNGFFSRGGAGKFELDVEELRQAFLGGSALVDRLRDYLSDRLSRIRSGDVPCPVAAGPIAALHMIPANSLLQPSTRQVDVYSNQARECAYPLPGSGYKGCRPTLDGLVSWWCEPSNEGFFDGYGLLFRSGIIESASSWVLHGGHNQPGVAAIAFERYVLQTISRWLKLYRESKISPPILISLSLLNVKGLSILTDRLSSIFVHNRIDRADCLLPVAWMESIDEDPGQVMREAFDALWNAAGWLGSPSYDENGDRRADR